jgi:hypothetical protein
MLVMPPVLDMSRVRVASVRCPIPTVTAMHVVPSVAGVRAVRSSVISMAPLHASAPGVRTLGGGPAGFRAGVAGPGIGRDVWIQCRVGRVTALMPFVSVVLVP